MIEAVLFFSLMFVFQYEISRFNKDLHISIDEYEAFRTIEHEIETRGGISYVQSHSGDYLDQSHDDSDADHDDLSA